MATLHREDLPYPDLPVDEGRFTATDPGSAVTVVDPEARFSGSLQSSSDLYIEGVFEGDIQCEGTVTVAEGGSLSATVRARTLVIAGSASGDFTCEERFVLRAGGEMRGKAQAATLMVEEGAFFEGEFKMATGLPASTSADWDLLPEVGGAPLPEATPGGTAGAGPEAPEETAAREEEGQGDATQEDPTAREESSEQENWTDQENLIDE